MIKVCKKKEYIKLNILENTQIADRDGDGDVNYQEFVKLMRRQICLIILKT